MFLVCDRKASEIEKRPLTTYNTRVDDIYLIGNSVRDHILYKINCCGVSSQGKASPYWLICFSRSYLSSGKF